MIWYAYNFFHEKVEEKFTCENLEKNTCSLVYQTQFFLWPTQTIFLPSQFLYF